MVWGIAPTGTETFSQADLPSLTGRLEAVWETLHQKGVEPGTIDGPQHAPPATCCLVNPDKEKMTVARDFASVNQMSRPMRDAYRLG